MTQKPYKSGFVAIVGRPNVGKSTLMNHLIGQKIAITSGKPQTTRNQIRTIYTSDEGQIIFLDTPGIHKAENRLGEYMDEVALDTLQQADVVLWIVEAADFSGQGERYIADKLKLAKKPVILVMNKIDTVQKKDIPGYMEMYRKLYPFDEIIPVSALRSVNTDSVLEAIFAHLPEGPQYYDEEEVTDQTMRQIASEMIREKALRILRDEVPHGIAVEITSMKERPKKHREMEARREDGPVVFDVSDAADPARERQTAKDDRKASRQKEYDDPDTLWDIEAVIITEKESHKGIIIGKGGSMLKKIGMQSREAIEEMVGAQVNLKLFVKVRKDWRDNAQLLKNLGYDPRNLK